MSEKKQSYQTDYMALPPLKMVLGDIPISNQKTKQQNGLHLKMNSREMEVVVQKLIDHFEAK